MSFSSKDTKNNLYKRVSAFTLVELLIVVVVIGIIATLVGLAYSGVKDRAHVATIQRDLSNGADLLAVDDLKNRQFPPNKAEANLGDGLPSSEDVSLTYVPGADYSSYCLQASRENNTMHVTNEDSEPTDGLCPVVPIDPPVVEVPEEPEPDPEPVLCDAYSVGSNGPAGGIIVYKASTEQSWGCYLEAAKSRSGGGWWCGSNDWCDEEVFTWGKRDQYVSTLNGIGNGMESTVNILNSYDRVTAAYKARDYNGGGKDDWYLPNRAELSKMMDFKDELNIKHGANWLAGTYWTSEQYNSDQGRNYKTGGKAYGCWGFCWITVHPGFTHEYKDNSLWKFARPVRTF